MGGNTALGLLSCRSGYRTPSKCTQQSRVLFTPACHHPLLLQEVCTREYRSRPRAQSTGCPHLQQPGDAPAIFVSCQKWYLDGHQCSTCRFLGSPATLSIPSSDFDAESTNLYPSLKGLANTEVEIVVIRIFDQRDNIYSLEHIGDNAYNGLASSIRWNAAIYRHC